MLRKTGIIISIALGLILTAAAICLCISLMWPDAENKLIPLLSNNWLLTIFKLHINIIDVSTNPLKGINLYDIFILIQLIIIFISLFITFKKQNKIWFVAATSLLIFGILVFIITQLAGRSTFMASGLIISIILFSKGPHYRLTGSIGIISNIFLLIGDFTVGANFKIVPPLFGLGYALVIIWIFMIAMILHRAKIPKNIQN